MDTPEYDHFQTQTRKWVEAVFGAIPAYNELANNRFELFTQSGFDRLIVECAAPVLMQGRVITDYKEAAEYHFKLAGVWHQEDKLAEESAQSQEIRKLKRKLANREAQRRFRDRHAGKVAIDNPEILTKLKSARDAWKKAIRDSKVAAEQWKQYVAYLKHVYQVATQEAEEEALARAARQRVERQLEEERLLAEQQAQILASGAAPMGLRETPDFPAGEQA